MALRKLKRPQAHERLLKKSDLYIAFLDILGFQDLIDQDDYPQKVEEIVRALQKRVEFDTPRYKPLHYLAISDSIIITAEEGHGRVLARKIGQVQNALLNLGYAVRGAITFGSTLTYDGKMGGNIFGRAYVQAYKAEKELSVYPRVIVTKDCATKLRQEIRDTSNQTVSTYVLRDADGISFINQFSSQVIGRKSETSRNRIAADAETKRFRTRVDVALKLTSGDAKANMKWRWLSRQLEEQLESDE